MISTLPVTLAERNRSARLARPGRPWENDRIVLTSRSAVTKETPVAPRGMVTAGHPLGAAVGARILRRGGNAVDAAVATAFAMAVVEPFMSCLAGGGSMLIHRPRRGDSVALDFNVAAPAGADARMYRLVDGRGTDIFPWRAVADDANIHGHRAVAVPGSVAGLTLALERYGTMALEDVVAPAVGLARNGVEIDWYLALVTATYMSELQRYPETARTYLREGRYPPRAPDLGPGDRMRYPALARTLALIGREGPQVFYRGELAEAIDAEIRRGGGVLTREDLAAYRVRVEAPLVGVYRGVSLLGMPGATGCVTAVEMLNVLESFSLGGRLPADPVVAHLRAESLAAAFRDRLRHLGDPAMVRAPWDVLAGKPYARALAETIREEGPRRTGAAPDPWRYDAAAGRPAEPGRRRSPASPGGMGRSAGSPRPGGVRRPGLSARAAATDCTTHVCAVDADRTLVSLTHTAVSLFGSKVVVPDTGLLLSNGMIWFDPEPGRPNSIAPGKRALVNMTPFLALRDGEPWLTVGAPGGRKIVSAVPQVIANLVDAGLAPQAAVESPRLHTEGDEIWIDDRVGPRTLAVLRRWGHRVVPQTESPSSFYFARPQVIAVTATGLVAGVDHLRPTAAAGL
jgi:gamma-glutamyltranspeptidase/glutathione hydrolase